MLDFLWHQPRRFAPLSLLLAIGAVACGSTADEPSTAPTSSTELRRCEAPTAPLTRIDGVAERFVIVGPCGDLMFAKTDESLWLRRRNGVLVALAEHATPDAFDAVGKYASFSRKNGERVLVDLDDASQHVLGEVSAIRFAYDPRSREPLPFACGRDDVRVFRSGTFESIRLGPSMLCKEHSPFGPTLMATGDGALTFVDLARGETHTAQGIDFRAGASEGTASREDWIYASLDGRIALYREIRQRPCGDTYCADPSGFDIVDTGSGRVVRHVERGLGDVLSIGRQLPDVVDRMGSLVYAPGSFGTPYSIDTTTGDFTEHKDTSIVDVVDDARFAFVRTSGPRATLGIGRAGSTETTTLAEVGFNGTLPALDVDRTGRRALFTEQKACVRLPGSPSCQAAATSSDLVLLRDGKEVRRVPGLNAISKPVFLSDDAVFLRARFFVGAVPDEAAYDTLRFEEGAFILSADGSLRRIAWAATTENSVREVSPRWLAQTESSYDGHDRTTRVSLFDRQTEQTQVVVESVGNVTELVPFGAEGPVSGLVAVSVIGPRDDKGFAPTSVWHGAPP